MMVLTNPNEDGLDCIKNSDEISDIAAQVPGDLWHGPMINGCCVNIVRVFIHVITADNN